MTTIVTDSTADLSREMAASLGVTVIPLHVSINDQTFTDGVDIDMPTLFSLVEKTGQLPTTAAPSAGAFSQAFSAPGDIVSINISSKLSATYQNALLAAGDEAGKRIRVIDSLNITSGMAMLVMKAVELARRGMPAAEIESNVQDLLLKVRVIILLDTLEYLYKGGRCSAIQRFAGSLLKIRPILEVSHDGTIGLLENSRGTRKKALDTLLGLMEKDLPQINMQRVFVTSTGCHEDAAYLADGIRKLCTPQELHTTLAGAVISSHCGPGTIGIIYMLR